MKKQIHFHMSMLATVAAVAVTGLNIYTAAQKESAPQEFSVDLSSSSQGAARGIAGVDTVPDLKSLYAAARESSANGNFDECLAALNTIHQQVTEYEASRELKSFCSEGKFRKAQVTAAKRKQSRKVATRR